MNNYTRYKKQYFPVKNAPSKWIEKDTVEKAPVWCSVDLRDGNQSLIIPMSLEEKLEFFDMLVKIGFKEIEVGFPAASDTEHEFLRTLIEENRIPDDVTVQVLTQSREHIIKKTFESLAGAKRAVVHLYNSTSLAQREQVFGKEKNEIIDIAVSGAKLLNEYAKNSDTEFTFEYSPESFTGTEPEFALEVCNAVLDIWKPTAARKAIINLPVTVEHSMPHVYANQVEFMCNNLKYRENVIVSLHPHNDRGCAVADTEFGLLAGADRVEGTLFGNGERTGNADIVTLAMNMFSQGIDPNLDLSDMPKIAQTYENLTRMRVYERLPYSGALVFAAFSGSHQDAIAKGMKWHEDKGCDKWTVPYLPIDPKDIGREYETDVIRINSQSGKGGIGYILEHNFGYAVPKKFCEEVSYFIKGVSDRNHKELLPDEIFAMFKDKYIDITKPFDVVDFKFEEVGESGVKAYLTVSKNGTTKHMSALGNGRLDAVSNAFKEEYGISFDNLSYTEHDLDSGSASRAVSYVGLSTDKKTFWGIGIHNDIIASSIKAFVSAVNRLVESDR